MEELRGKTVLEGLGEEPSGPRRHCKMHQGESTKGGLGIGWSHRTSAILEGSEQRMAHF